MTEGKDPATGRFLPQNRFWEARSSQAVLKAPAYANADDLWAACCEYFDWNARNPLYETQAKTVDKNIEIIHLPKMRAMSYQALARFIGVTYGTWCDWRRNRADLANVIDWVEAIIRQQKFEGAAAGFLKENIIMRDLGMAEKQDHTSSDGSMSPPTSVTFQLCGPEDVSAGGDDDDNLAG